MVKLEINKLDDLDYQCEEAINTLCTNLSFVDDKIQRIMFTSCHENEGKSFTSIHVMKTLAKLGYSVTLVDADLRKSVMMSKNNISGVNKGLSHYLAGHSSIEDIVYSTNIPNAFIVPVGITIRNPLTLLNSDRFEVLLNYLTENTDYVIIDAPPVGRVIDAAQIAKSCDGIVVVVKYNGVTRRELQETILQLEQTKCPILGTVLSMVKFDTYSSKKYYYKSYYSEYSYSDDQDHHKKDRK